MLVIHWGKDYRVPEAEGLGAFTAFQRRNIPSRFLYFPDENHWVLRPQYSIRWYDTVLDWLDQWTKKAPFAGDWPTDTLPGENFCSFQPCRPVTARILQRGIKVR
jgi:hypothetical protein